MTYIIFSMVVMGLLAGIIAPNSVQIPQNTEPIIFSVMLFGIGVELGQDRNLWSKIRHSGWRMMLFPLNIIIGTLIGAVVANWLLHGQLRQTMAISAGFGWYTLAAVLANELDGPKIAAIAFISNVLREILSFMLIPIIAPYAQGALAIAVGGATTMDTTLPLITRHTKGEAAVYAFVNGVIVSSLVPIVIPFIYKIL
jgi:uncharacterized membrane protein YbjE (DUF340 family)